jgi:aldehyde:ferredoxin oxidoreductase
VIYWQKALEGLQKRSERALKLLLLTAKAWKDRLHDPRAGKALTVTYGTANRGMCHIHLLEGMAYDSGKMDWGLMKYDLPDPNNVERWAEKGTGIEY